MVDVVRLTVLLLSVDCASVEAEVDTVLVGAVLGELLNGTLELLLVAGEELEVGCEEVVELASWLGVVDGAEDSELDVLGTVGVVTGMDEVDVTSGVLVVVMMGIDEVDVASGVLVAVICV
jgi:hypothetical protein